MRVRVSTRPTTLVLCAALLLAGCSGTADRPQIFSTSVGPRLESLTGAHGGYENWKKFAGATFEYRAEFEEGFEIAERLTLIFDQPHTVWVYRGGLPPQEGTIPWAWTVVPLGEESPRAWRPEGPRAPPPELAHYSLLSLRNLFQLPFQLATDSWKLRRAVAPGKENHLMPDEIEAAPENDPSLLGPYLLQWREDGDEDTARPLERLFYASNHPGRSRTVYEVLSGGFLEVQGLLVVTAREHFQRTPPPRQELPDPLELAPLEPPAAPGPALRETLRSVRFLTAEDLVELLEITPLAG